MKPLLILADDLTGAADTAARCRYTGLPSTIYLQPPRPPLPAGVSAFTSDSRHLLPAAAAQRVTDVVAPLRSYEARWYKKIDSTLRGNLGSELDALLDSIDTTTAIVCPAFPAQKRGLIDGRLVTPALPPSSIHLPSLLREQSRRRVESINLTAVRTGTLVEQMHATRSLDGKLLVIDANAESDLNKILAAVELCMPDALLCGSAGLVGALAARESKLKTGDGSRSPVKTGNFVESKHRPLRTLLVIGSGSDTAHRQIKTLIHQQAEIISLEIDSVYASLAERCDPSGPTWLLHLPRPAPGASLDGPQARARADDLGKAALVFIERLQPTLLILSGGDTAVNVLQRLGVEHLTVQTELLAGMPLCSALTDSGKAIDVIMKPGSFGDERTLATLLEKSAMFLSALPD